MVAFAESYSIVPSILFVLLDTSPTYLTRRKPAEELSVDWSSVLVPLNPSTKVVAGYPSICGLQTLRHWLQSSCPFLIFFKVMLYSLYLANPGLYWITRGASLKSGAVLLINLNFS